MLLPTCRYRPLVYSLLLVLFGLLAASGARAQVLRGTFAASETHSLAIHADGTLWATGDNRYGQLGTGNTISTTAWVQVGTASNWTMVATGTYHSLGLRADGSLWAWGYNSNGQLGNNINLGYGSLPNPTPAQVAGTYTQIAAGTYHSLGLRADGSLWAWGYNINGQLGNPTYAGSGAAIFTPVQATGGPYTQVAATAFHTLALKADGSLWAWGNNRYGQLGNNNIGNSNSANPTPTQVAGTYTQMAAGTHHTLALRADGSLWSWGNNSNGQLGNSCIGCVGGTSATPVQAAGTYT